MFDPNTVAVGGGVVALLVVLVSDHVAFDSDTIIVVDIGIALDVVFGADNVGVAVSVKVGFFSDIIIVVGVNVNVVCDSDIVVLDTVCFAVNVVFGTNIIVVTVGVVVNLVVA